MYLCAASGDESGQQALEWTLDNLVEDGDELVAVRGFELADLRKCQHVVDSSEDGLPYLSADVLLFATLSVYVTMIRQGHARSSSGRSQRPHEAHPGTKFRIRWQDGKSRSPTNYPHPSSLTSICHAPPNQRLSIFLLPNHTSHPISSLKIALRDSRVRSRQSYGHHRPHDGALPTGHPRCRNPWREELDADMGCGAGSAGCRERL